MKILKVSFLVALLSSSYASQAIVFVDLDRIEPRLLGKNIRALFIEDLEFFALRQKLIEKNFKDEQCITEKSSFTAVNEEFKNLTSYFPRDEKLKSFYARFLMLHGKIDDGIDEFSKFILHSKNSSLDDHISDFMNILSILKLHNQPLHEYIRNIKQAIEDPLLYAKGKPWYSAIKNPRSKNGSEQINNKLLGSFLEEATSFFSLLESFPNKNVYNATFKVIHYKLTNTNIIKNMRENLVYKLYTKNQAAASPFVIECYATDCILQKKYEKAISLYESILGSDPDPDPDNLHHSSKNYSDLGYCYYQQTAKLPLQIDDLATFEHSPDDLVKLQKAAALFAIAVRIDGSRSPSVLNNLSCVQIHLKQYEEAFQITKNLINKPEDFLKKQGLNIGDFKKGYMALLQLTNRTEELKKILCEKQQQILRKNKQIADLIKFAQEQHTLEKQKAQKEEQERQDALQQSRQNNIKFTKTAETVSGEPFDYVGSSEKEVKYKIKEKASKKKTRNPAPQQAPAADVKPELEKSLIHLNTLIKNKNALNTFEKLFEKYNNNIKSDSNVKISFTEIDCFFEALDQKFEKSNSTSHQKVTLNFQDVGSEMGDQMVLLTSKTYLKPEQIKALREAFVKARIVPNDPDLIKKLKEKGLL